MRVLTHPGAVAPQVVVGPRGGLELPPGVAPGCCTTLGTRLQLPGGEGGGGGGRLMAGGLRGQSRGLDGGVGGPHNPPGVTGGEPALPVVELAR